MGGFGTGILRSGPRSPGWEQGQGGLPASRLRQAGPSRAVWEHLPHARPAGEPRWPRPRALPVALPGLSRASLSLLASCMTARDHSDSFLRLAVTKIGSGYRGHLFTNRTPPPAESTPDREPGNLGSPPPPLSSQWDWFRASVCLFCVLHFRSRMCAIERKVCEVEATDIQSFCFQLSLF